MDDQLPHYEIVPDRSRVSIAVQSGIHRVEVTTDQVVGWLDLDPVPDAQRALGSAMPAGRLSVPVDALKSGNPLEDRELRRRIDVRRFPTIEAALGDMRKADDGDGYSVRGEVTCRGVTHTYEGEVTVERLDATTISLAGESTFDVRDFGLQPPRLLMFRVAPEVRVRLAVVARSG